MIYFLASLFAASLLITGTDLARQKKEEKAVSIFANSSVERKVSGGLAAGVRKLLLKGQAKMSYF